MEKLRKLITGTMSLESNMKKYEKGAGDGGYALMGLNVVAYSQKWQRSLQPTMVVGGG